MEKMIRDIVDADREARLRLLEKQKKDNIQSLIREERESIKASAGRERTRSQETRGAAGAADPPGRDRE